MAKFFKFINSKYFFIGILILYIFLYVFLNFDSNKGNLTSDTWMEQYLVSLRDQPSQVPLVNREKFYVAPYLFYYLNPGLESDGVLSYHLLAIFIIVLIYVVNGLIIKKIFNSWFLAALAGIIFLIPRYVFSTHIGMLDFRNLRGLSLVFPFYLLLSYYWIIYGIKSKKQNIFLAILAALQIYLYPPVGMIIMPMFILTALIVHKKKYLKEIIIFVITYLIFSSLFLFSYFSSSNLASTALLGKTFSLNEAELKIQTEILHYRIPDISLGGIDFGTLKRSIWDGSPLLIAFLLSLFLFKKHREKLAEEYRTFFRVSVVFTAVLLFFAISVEIVNNYLYLNGQMPIFIEHLRLLRVLGFVWIAQAILVIFIYYNILNKKIAAAILMLALLIMPVFFSAPFIRSTIRFFLPESIRIKYNLAPIVTEEEVRDFNNLEDMAIWTKENLLSKGVKFFVFDDFQNEFKFKVLSGKDTNFTSKEGPIYIVSSFEDSKKWYEERRRYEEITGLADNFDDIVSFARELNSTHILLPRGKFTDLFNETKSGAVGVLYSNGDYKILEIKQ